MLLKKLILIVVIGAFAIHFAKRYAEYSNLTSVSQPAPVTVLPTSLSTTLPSTKMSPEFECDGRQHCSQMTSYAEAKFFLQNCPNTKMDGDNDGIPCESQFAKDIGRFF